MNKHLTILLHKATSTCAEAQTITSFHKSYEEGARVYVVYANYISTTGLHTVLRVDHSVNLSQADLWVTRLNTKLNQLLRVTTP